MPFQWKQYLELARTLSISTADHAALRSAISRSYYCVYNLALNQAVRSGFDRHSNRLGSSHANLWNLYEKNRQSRECQMLAKFGKRMKKRRQYADYEAEYLRLEDDARDAITDAEECIEYIARLPAGLPVSGPARSPFESIH